MRSKLTLVDLSIFVTLAAATLPFFFRNLGREAGSFAFLWAPITLLSILFTRPNAFFRGPMKVLLLYGVIMVGILQYTLWRYIDDWNRPRILLEFYFLVISTVALMYYLSKGDFKKLALLSKWTFISIIISLIATNVALFFDPYVVRQAASTADFTPFQAKVYKLSGAMGYSYVQAIICLIPILIYHIRIKEKMVFEPKVLLAILILILITEIRAQVFANILISMVITILSIIGSKNRRISFITMLFFTILLIAIPNSFFSNISISLSNYFDPDSVMKNKLIDFATFIENPELDATTETGSRAERYPLLFKALTANPFLGNASYKSRLNIMSGAHLFWMNRLALWGIPGFLFFVFMLYKIFRTVSSLFDSSFKFNYFLSMAALLLLGLIKAVGGSELWLILIVVIPGLYFLPLLEKKRHFKNQT